MTGQQKVKDHIRQRFCRAAHSYDQYAHVQRQAAGWLLDSLQAKPQRILEIGCGTGNLTALLAEAFPQAEITALDFADTMVEQATAKLAGASQVTFRCEDGESFIRTATEKYDLVISNATLQWFSDLQVTFKHLARLVGEGGSVALSLFGPGSFAELARAMREVVDPDIRLPAESFSSAQSAEEIARTFFSEVAMTRKMVHKEYGTFFDILDHIKKTGTGGYHEKIPHLSRAALKRLDEWFAGHGGYAISYEIFIIGCQEGARR